MIQDSADRPRLLVAHLLALAAGGIVAGAGAGCRSSESAGEGVEQIQASAEHACKGLNACRGQGGCASGENGCAGKNSCKGTGGCATVEQHACAGLNGCKGLGGCRSGDNGCAGKNSCRAKGGCAVPVRF